MSKLLHKVRGNQLALIVCCFITSLFYKHKDVLCEIQQAGSNAKKEGRAIIEDFAKRSSSSNEVAELAFKRLREKEGGRLVDWPQNDSLLDFGGYNYQRGICLQIKGEAENSGEKRLFW